MKGYKYVGTLLKCITSNKASRAVKLKIYETVPYGCELWVMAKNNERKLFVGIRVDNSVIRSTNLDLKEIYEEPNSECG